MFEIWVLMELYNTAYDRYGISKNVKLKDLACETEDFSGAEIKAVCTEAGYFAIRDKRDYISSEDFVQAIDKVFRMEEEEDFDMITG